MCLLLRSLPQCLIQLSYSTNSNFPVLTSNWSSPVNNPEKCPAIFQHKCHIKLHMCHFLSILLSFWPLKAKTSLPTFLGLYMASHCKSKCIYGLPMTTKESEGGTSPGATFQHNFRGKVNLRCRGEGRPEAKRIWWGWRTGGLINDSICAPDP